MGAESRHSGTRPAGSVPDLELDVDCKHSDGRIHLSYKLRFGTRRFGAGRKDVGSVSLPSDPEGRLKGLFSEIEELRERREQALAERRLVGIGARLLDFLPPELQRKLWTWHERRSAQEPAPTLYLISNETWIPWELLRLRDPDAESKEGVYLVDAFAFTRWLEGRPDSTEHPLQDLAVVVPKESKLEHAAAEKEMLLGWHDEKRRRVTPIVPASYQNVTEHLESGGYDGWHLTGHGLRQGENPDLWSFQLEDYGSLKPLDVPVETGLGEKRPLVFLNSCHGGHGGYTPTGIGGWADAFLRAGAGAFIGAYWEVSDEAAKVFAEEFYERFLAGAPISEAVRGARARIREGFPEDPTWAAYTVYAHPLAVCTAGVPERPLRVPPESAPPAESPARSKPPLEKPPRKLDVRLWQRPFFAPLLVVVGFAIAALTGKLGFLPSASEPTAPSVDLWKVGAGLGIPGLALVVFYMLFKKLDWKLGPVPSKWTGLLLALFMVLVTAVALFAIDRFAPNPQPVLPPIPTESSSAPPETLDVAPVVEPRTAVAVLSLRNRSGKDFAWLSTALSELLTTELGVSGEIRAVDRDAVAWAERDFGLDADQISNDDSARLRSYLGVDHVLSGFYQIDVENSFLIGMTLFLKDTSSNITPAPVVVTGEISQPSTLVKRAGKVLRDKLDMGERSPREEVQVTASFPADLTAARLYSEALASYREFDAAGAKPLLLEAITNEDEDPHLHALLARIWAALGNLQEARKAARAAAERSAELPPQKRIEIEALNFRMERDWDEVIKSWNKAISFFPDDIGYYLLLAEAQFDGGRLNESLVSLEEIRERQLIEIDPRIELKEARAYKSLGDYDKAISRAEQAVAKARKLNSNRQIAMALLTKGSALLYLGEYDKSKEALNEARDRFERYGDKRLIAQTLEVLAFLYEDVHLRTAIDLYGEIIELYEDVGDRRGRANAQHLLGSLLGDRGRLTEARSSLEEALNDFREIDSPFDAAVVQSSIGSIYLLYGDLTQAEKWYSQAMIEFEGLSRADYTATILTNIAEIKFMRGQIEDAEILHSQSLESNIRNGIGEAIPYDIYRLGKVDLVRGTFASARDKYEEALRQQEESGKTFDAARTRLALSELEFFEKNFDEAERLTRQAAETFRAFGDVGEEALAEVGLARIYLARGRLDSSQEAFNTARLLAESNKAFQVRYAVDIMDARLRAASGDPAEVDRALGDLWTITDNAREAGHVLYEFESRFAWGEIAMATGHQASAGRRALAELIEDADALGFRLISQRATAASPSDR